MAEPTEEELAAIELAAEEEAKVKEGARIKEEEEEAARVKKEEEEEAARVKAASTNKQTAQERIDEITYKFREAERQADYWKQLAVGGGEEDDPSVPLEKPAAGEGNRPVVENFDTTAEYEDALFTWYDDKKIKRNQEANAGTQLKKDVDNFKKSAVEFKKAHEDYDKVLETPVFSGTMRSVLLTMEGGAELAYYIAKNPEISNNFKNLSPEQQIFKIADMKNELKLAQSTRSITNAPNPFEPSGSTGQAEKDPDKMTTEEWMAWNKEQDLKKLKSKMGE